MKKILVYAMLVMLIGGLVSCGGATEEKPTANGNASQGAMVDNDLTLEEMLVYGIQDEHNARKVYINAMAKFGPETSPFETIKINEDDHVNYLTPLFEKNGFVVPADESDTYAPKVEKMTEFLQGCIDGEVNNIAMYEKFLAVTPPVPEDVAQVFKQLIKDSKSHKKSFEIKLENLPPEEK